jgi:hypothetical protein
MLTAPGTVWALPLRVHVLMLLCRRASAQQHGSSGCRCLNSTAWRPNFATQGNASLVVNLTQQGGGTTSSYDYPFGYGLGSCKRWDVAMEPYCSFANGTALPAAPSWCQERWCWVDPVSCDQADVAASAYFPNSGAYFSYSTCGASNTFGAWFLSHSCSTTAATSHYPCSHLKTTPMWVGSGAWSDQLGTAHTCGASPRPCQTATLLQAAATCQAAGGRLCTQAEVLNNEVGGTGCGFDAAEIWTSSRGKCDKGEFMTVAGIANNAVPVPLGKGMPACAAISELKAVRCCGDEQVNTPRCPASVATCSELQWPIQTPAGSDAFCAGNHSMYTCAGSASKCFERMARPCTQEEVTAAAASLPSVPNSTKVQLMVGHAPSDQCMCCADLGVMPEPCTRPHKIFTTNTSAEYSFEISTDQARRCYWVFDGDGCGDGGVQLRFTEAKLTNSIPGDGWRVFVAQSPVNLVQVQNLQFPRNSILAEIRDDAARRFRRDTGGVMKVPHGQNFSSRQPHSEYLVNAHTPAVIVELKAMAKGAALSGTFARFSVQYRCAAVTGGCLDSAAANYQSNASYDDGSCAYPPPVSSCGNNGCNAEYTCTSNPQRESDECACVITDRASTSFYNASAHQFNATSADQYNATLAPYLGSSCATVSNSTTFIDAVNSGTGGIYWLRFTGATRESSTDLVVDHETIVIEGMGADDLAQSALPEWNGGKIFAVNSALLFIRKVSIRNRVSLGNAAVAQILTGSMLSMADVLIENSFAGSDPLVAQPMQAFRSHRECLACSKFSQHLVSHSVDKPKHTLRL